ncbi:MAG TPA: helix-turn-helix domain-containing protein [Solirubrobacteraceae bacterium]|jgi:DNA-binding HxlR family transcriptional regulator
MANVVTMSGSLEPRGGWVADRCPIAETLEVVSTRSAFILLREAFYGTTRFDDFATRARLSEPVTSARLRELVDHGLLKRAEYREPGQRTRQAYELTEKGADLFPVLAAMMEWGSRWLDERGGPVKLRHRGCGADVGVHLTCDAGHEVASGDVELARNRPPRPTASPADAR